MGTEGTLNLHGKGEEFRLFLVSLFITFPQCRVLGHVTYVRPS